MPHQVISAGGVVLRPTTAADLDTLRAVFTDPGVNEHWGAAPLPDVEIVAKYTGLRSPEVESFLVERSGLAIGYMQYWIADDDGEGDGIDGGGIDLVLLPSVRGQGVGTAAVHAMVNFLRSERGWKRITVDPDLSNQRGLRFWTAVGFRPELLVEGDPERDPYWLMSWPM